MFIQCSTLNLDDLVKSRNQKNSTQYIAFDYSKRPYMLCRFFMTQTFYETINLSIRNITPNCGAAVCGPTQMKSYIRSSSGCLLLINFK